jgi:hypothetical protein
VLPSRIPRIARLMALDAAQRVASVRWDGFQCDVRLAVRLPGEPNPILGIIGA